MKNQDNLEELPEWFKVVMEMAEDSKHYNKHKRIMGGEILDEIKG